MVHDAGPAFPTGLNYDDVIRRLRTGRVGLAIKQINTGALPNLRLTNRLVHALARY